MSKHTRPSSHMPSLKIGTVVLTPVTVRASRNQLFVMRSHAFHERVSCPKGGAFAFEEITGDALGSLWGVREEKHRVQSCDRLMGAVMLSPQSVRFLGRWVEDEIASNFERRGKYLCLAA